VAENTAHTANQTHNHLLEKEHEAELKELRDWLSKYDYKTHHEQAGNGLMPGSGTWVLTHHKFTKWRDFPSSSALWLHGIRECYQLIEEKKKQKLLSNYEAAGSGKTNLVYV
jgi:hypothetical protein